jgi:hypothetical protein
MIPLGRSALAQRPPAYGAIYVATGAGEGAAYSIVAIDPQTLQTKSAYTAIQEFASTPEVFEYKEMKTSLCQRA